MALERGSIRVSQLRLFLFLIDRSQGSVDGGDPSLNGARWSCGAVDKASILATTDKSSTFDVQVDSRLTPTGIAKNSEAQIGLGELDGGQHRFKEVAWCVMSYR
jgi:hypothetical protein